VSLTLKNISKVVGGQVHVHDVNLAFENGSLNVLLGQTLAGKTSLMRLMAGLDVPTNGAIIVDGRDVTGVPVRHRNIAMVYQQFINYPTLTVFENIASPLRVAGLSKDEIEARVGEAARLLKLNQVLDRTPLQLSGGQQQRTAIARALVKRAELVLMDEPLANLDYKLREELREELPRVFSTSGAVFVYATTEPTEALLLGGNTATLCEGRATQYGRTADVYRNPKDLTTARVFSDPPLNIVGMEKRNGQLALATGKFDSVETLFSRLADGAYTLAFRAHQLRFNRPSGPSLQFSGTVAVSEITGSESFVHIEMPSARFVALASGVHRYEPGTGIETFVDPADIFIFDGSGRLSGLPSISPIVR
jgi:glycerol transport system ATP-binding protein